MGHRAKEDKRFWNGTPTRSEVMTLVKNYHAEQISKDIETANMSVIRILLTLLVETGVVEQGKLNEFMKKASEIAAIEQKMGGDSDTPADKPE